MFPDLESAISRLLCKSLKAQVQTPNLEALVKVSQGSSANSPDLEAPGLEALVQTPDLEAPLSCEPDLEASCKVS